MSRGPIILIVFLLLVIGGAVVLASRNTEVVPKLIEKPVTLNAAAPQ